MAKRKKNDTMVGKENTGDDMRRMAAEMMKGRLRMHIEMPDLPEIGMSHRVPQEKRTDE